MKTMISKNDAIFYIFLAVIGTIIAGIIGWCVPILHGDNIGVSIIVCVIFFVLTMKHAEQINTIYGNGADGVVAYVFLILSGASLIVFLKSAAIWIVQC